MLAKKTNEQRPPSSSFAGGGGGGDDELAGSNEHQQLLRRLKELRADYQVIYPVFQGQSQPAAAAAAAYFNLNLGQQQQAATQLNERAKVFMNQEPEAAKQILEGHHHQHQKQQVHRRSRRSDGPQESRKNVSREMGRKKSRSLNCRKLTRTTTLAIQGERTQFYIVESIRKLVVLVHQ